jgi:hypothetical protein
VTGQRHDARPCTGQPDAQLVLFLQLFVRLYAA